MIIDDIRKELFRHQDIKYRDFQYSLIPTVNPENIIGVRTPVLKDLAKQFAKHEDIGLFLDDLPHRYFDENQLHAFIISGIRDYELCMAEVIRFLPFIDMTRCWAAGNIFSCQSYSSIRLPFQGQ